MSKLIDELERLDGEATAGPWVAHNAAVGIEREAEIFEQLTHQYGPHSAQDGQLIVLLRNNLPKFIALYRAAKAHHSTGLVSQYEDLGKALQALEGE